MQNGERANWQGHIFSNYSRDFVLKLGYKEIFSSKYDIDFLGEPIKTPSAMLVPRSAPDGITAFEFSSQSNISEQLIRKFATKIAGIKSKYNVTGGVIVCDIRISDDLYDFALNHNIYIWDLRDCGFYAEKYRICELLKETGHTQETALGDRITYVWTLDRASKSGFFKGYLCILFHQPIGEIMIGYVDSQFTNIHHQIADNLKNIGCVPIEVEVIWLLRPYVSKDVHLGIGSLLKRFSDEETVTYTLHGLYNFYIAPWYFGLHSHL